MPLSLKIAESPGDYLAAQKLMKSEGQKAVNLKYPTILAFDVASESDATLIGVLGTHHQDELIIAGPLVLESSFPRFKTALQLCEAYEHAMRTLGVKSFIMYTEDDGIMEQAIQRYQPEGLEHYATQGNNKFYIRRL